MTGLLDNAEITIECPSCRRKIKQRLGRLKDNQALRCLCGQDFVVRLGDKGSVAQVVKAANKGFSRLDATIKKFGK